MRRTVIGVGLVILAACGHDVGTPTSKTGMTRQPLIAADQKYIGDDLQDHELALTFDDGPGPMDVSGDLAQWLVNRPTPIHVTYFINGACVAKTFLSEQAFNASCGDPVDGADDVMTKERSLGHWIGDHTTTHRDLVTEVLPTGADKVVQELVETDGLIASHLVWNRLFFRAPYGSYSPAVFNALKGTAMNKYVGPVYWNAGGGPTDVAQGMAADWECWQGVASDGNKTYSTKKCGDLYLAEIRRLGKGIVLMHDAKGDTSNHSLTTGTGNTHDMAQYIIPILESEGFTFKRLDEIPSLAAVLPACDASCSDCKGPAATDCTACTPDKHLDATGACVAGAPTGDGGDGGVTDPGPTTSTTDPTGGATTTTPAGDNTNAPAPPVAAADAGATGAPTEKGGCNATGSSGTDGAALSLLAAVGLVISRRLKRRRT